MKYNYTIEELTLAAEKSLSIAGVCRLLNINVVGGNYVTLKNKFIKYNIDTSHFTGKAWNQGDKFKPFGKTFELNEILIENSPYRNGGSLKKRLLKENQLKYECDKCGNVGIWNNKKLVLQLDHINGINSDNRINNLRLLCPNCHTQTKTFAGRNSIGSKNYA